MLAPWCEAESATPEVTAQSLSSLDWWDAHVPGVIRNGTLVLAPARDVREIARFGRRTSHFTTIGEGEIADLEPDLADRFSRALLFAGKAMSTRARHWRHLPAGWWNWGEACISVCRPTRI